MTATQQVKEKRGARAHAYEARAELSLNFTQLRGKIAQEQQISKLRLPPGAEDAISHGGR